MQHEQVLARTDAHRARSYRFRRHLSVDESEQPSVNQTDQGSGEGVCKIINPCWNILCNIPL